MATVLEGNKTERFRFIEMYRSDLGFEYLCDWLGVSKSGFHKWSTRKPSKRKQINQSIGDRIEALFFEHKTNYGSPRITKALRDEGLIVNHKRVERIMQERGLVGKAGRIYRRKAVPEKFYTKMPNLKKDMDEPTGVDQQWVGDLTYLKVGRKQLYLAVVMDLYSRRVLGWSLGERKSSELTVSALSNALKHRTVTEQHIFHTDRGSEYGAYLIQNELKRVGIKSSMNRPKTVTDNAAMESFFQSMKTEMYTGVHFKSETELRAALSWYLDKYYNQERLHSSIGYTNPTKYEKMAA